MSSIFDDVEQRQKMESATRSLLSEIISRMTLEEQLRLIGRLAMEGYE
jgi:hypothetical protein